MGKEVVQGFEGENKSQGRDGKWDNERYGQYQNGVDTLKKCIGTCIVRIQTSS